MFASKAGAYARLDHMLIANNIVDWKGLPETNPLAYYEHSLIMDVNVL